MGTQRPTYATYLARVERVYKATNHLLKDLQDHALWRDSVADQTARRALVKASRSLRLARSALALLADNEEG